MSTAPRSGGSRKPKGKKGPMKGTGGHGRKALEGRGPTPKAEDRVYHKAHRAKQLAERSAAKRGPVKDQVRGRVKLTDETVSGRNPVLEALRAGIPAKALHVAVRIEMDDRVKEALRLCLEQGVPVLENTKPELDRLSGEAVHQGIVLQIPPYEYADATALALDALAQHEKGHLRTPPLLIALDGITDPRNLGAIIRSVGAFGGHGVVVPERRSVGMTASAWKTSAGAASRVPVAQATNLTRTLQDYRKQGYFVIGLDMDGDVELPQLDLADQPLVVVVGSEGKGLSRLVGETCDQIVSIPMASGNESLNAGIACGVTLYEIARQRAATR